MSHIEIVLTDFGMAESDSRGGTPVFASPECFEKKDKKSDIFSFGRVILFLLLTKEQFTKWLFVPIRVNDRLLQQKNDERLLALIVHTLNVGRNIWSLASGIYSRLASGLYLVTHMTSIKKSKRIDLHGARTMFNKLKSYLQIIPDQDLISEFDLIVNRNFNAFYGDYISELSEFRLSKQYENLK